ncbi:hypothetical protein KO465_03195 [Candidatus Micrarchaeota archaeon]|jgi:hypothetical protein|nr:hypothetical protein [Candidatus Micrarchaeota archaeon]
MSKQISLTLAEVNELLNNLVGLVINRTWRGYGSAIFFEIGELNEENIGQFTFTADKDWILCLDDHDCISCDNLELDEMDQLLDKFISSKIIDIKIDENSLVIALDNNKNIKVGDYQKDNWSLQIGDETSVFYKDGFLKEKGA